MKKFILSVAMIFLLANSLAFAREVTIGFEWQPNIESDAARYVLYHRVEGQGYSYDIPKLIIPCTLTNGKCLSASVTEEGACTVEAKMEIADGTKTVNYFIMRAEDTDGNESEDSNEVFTTIDLTDLLASTDFTAVFNKVAQTIDFSWTQPGLERVTYWELYSSEVSGGPYTKINTINYDGVATTISSSLPASTLASGKEYFFTVVAFAKFEIYSPNSNEIGIDRLPPAKIILKIKLVK